MRKVLYILGQLSDDDVEWLAAHGQRQIINKGQVLVEQGVPVASLYFILDGQFEVSAQGVGQLAMVGCGEIIGEISLIDSRPPAASVLAVEPAVVLAIDHALLQRKLADDILFAAHFYRAVATFLAERMRSTVKRMGYGSQTELDPNQELDGELDISVLDNVHLAGARFDRILKQFQG